MKKISITIITLLIVLLIGQLIMYNINSKNKAGMSSTNTMHNENIKKTENQSAKKENTENNNSNQDVETTGIIGLSRLYTGNLTDLENSIKNFTDNIMQIQKACTKQNLNYRLQYYDLHTEEVQKLHIYSAEDYQKISIQITNMLWSQNPQVTSYEIELSTYEEKENYATFDLIIKYSSDDTIKLKISLALDSNTTPNIRIANNAKVNV